MPSCTPLPSQLSRHFAIFHSFFLYRQITTERASQLCNCQSFSPSRSIFLSLSLFHSQYLSLVSIFLILSLYSYSLLFLFLVRSHSALYASFSFLSLHLYFSFFLPLSTHAHAHNYLKICKIVWRSASAFKHQKTIPDLMIIRKDKMMFS